MFWVTLARGIFALVLGVGIMLYPDKTRPTLVNFMGMYWLMSGIVSVRWGVRGGRAQGLPVLAGGLGILAGGAVLARFMLRSLLAESLIIFLLAFIMLLTGLVHLFGGFKTAGDAVRQRSLATVLLGLFQVGLAIILLFSPLGWGTLFYLLLTGWALLGGLVLILDALSLQWPAHGRKGAIG